MTNEITKSVRLHKSLWQGIADVRFSHRFQSEADAVRAIVAAGIASMKKPRRTNKGETP